MGLGNLPYDLLLNIATYLDLRDVQALHLTCRSLYEASTTRTVYRKLAHDLLRRCRPLPLKGFQRLSDLTTEQLIRSVNKAAHYERSWRYRAPRPITNVPHSESGVHAQSNYMDIAPKTDLANQLATQDLKWYKIVSAPPGEDVDWLSPITSSYTLCATKSGKVVCWDVQSDTCLAEWDPKDKWELWKCRVEFEERAVFFTMAKTINDSYDDERVMEFVLMRLTFSDSPSGESSSTPPVFSRVSDFRTAGVVMNVFLLDPSERLLSAFVWVSSTNTIGLFALLDWDRNEYVFVDTGIECVLSSNWSCILYQDHIVIHSEESDAAYQHFYPISLLRNFVATLPCESAAPVLSAHLPPPRTLKKKFIFPAPEVAESDTDTDLDLELEHNSYIHDDHIQEALRNAALGIPILDGAPADSSYLGSSDDLAPDSAHSSQTSSPSSSTSATLSSTHSSHSSYSSSSTVPVGQEITPVENPNPYPFPPWYPESAHFVRQWWPSLPSIPRVSCTVVLLAAHDQMTHRTRFVIAQHYFRVPLDHREWERISANDIISKGYYNAQASECSSYNRHKGSTLVSYESAVSSSEVSDGKANGMPSGEKECLKEEVKPTAQSLQDDALMHLWYVSTPFEVVRVFDSSMDDEDGVGERPRPLVAVDFGHAVWIEYADDQDEDELDGDDAGLDEPKKCLRFVTFPPFNDELAYVEGEEGVKADVRRAAATRQAQAEVRTLETPPELDLGMVETINIDQSQGAVILSDKLGRIFILCYE
ncbi:hypothetical protein CVT24_008544 [Panaeolus cyanescens]|uniref:F-box domain-containing protein n=1 Tax=Panaeolus cyanescens TaxID=181874 RepID=A0A409VED4_9AGAR|nr:hypothetical protein CVT24_008544 [Panaeolus cyanescens]